MYLPKRKGLPVKLGFDQRSDGTATMDFRCGCGELVNLTVAVEAYGSEATGRCKGCGTFLTLIARQKIEADGGKPGSGK